MCTYTCLTTLVTFCWSPSTVRWEKSSLLEIFKNSGTSLSNEKLRKHFEDGLNYIHLFKSDSTCSKFHLNATISSFIVVLFNLLSHYYTRIQRIPLEECSTCTVCYRGKRILTSLYYIVNDRITEKVPIYIYIKRVGRVLLFLRYII